MANIAPIRPSTSVANELTNADLALIRRTVAADTNEDEFNLFISYCRALRLDPRRRQIYALVYNKGNADRRKMTIIVAIDGFRAIADRTGNYRPDEDEPSFEVDPALVSVSNPAGLVKATVRVHKFAHGAWHKVTASAYWSEYAPLKDGWSKTKQIQNGTWPDGNPRFKTVPDEGASKTTTLDDSGNWAKMPRLMLAKVAEALALRKAWPDDFSGVYAEEEFDRTKAVEMTPAEAATAGEVEKRLEKIGGSQAIIFDWLDNNPLDAVPVGQIGDRISEFLKKNSEEPTAVFHWQNRNRHALREYWAKCPGEALEIKRKIENAIAEAA